MVYEWKIPNIYSVSAQTAGEELNRIYQERGQLEPADIVNESRAVDAPLHPCFEWDDAVAAEKYRENQASGIIRAIVTVGDEPKKADCVRAFVHVENTYRPMTAVVNSESRMQELLMTALSELSAFRRKYSSLSKLGPVFSAIDRIQSGGGGD